MVGYHIGTAWHLITYGVFVQFCLCSLYNQELSQRAAVVRRPECIVRGRSSR